MHFTREPIIETIITPRDGYKLTLRSSKLDVDEEYQMDALEVVSFGSVLFFRSQEKPHSFLLPVCDYEVIEEKEARIGLKTAHLEKNIKIGGGRENPSQKVQNEKKEERKESSSESHETNERDKKRSKRHRRRNPDERRNQWRSDNPEEVEAQNQQAQAEQIEEAESSDETDETQALPLVFTPIIPPPTVLISETLSRYKDAPFLETKKKSTETQVKPDESVKITESETIVLEMVVEPSSPEEPSITD